MIKLPPGRYVEGGREYVFDSCPSCKRPNVFYWSPGRKKGQCWRKNHCGVTVHDEKQLSDLCGGLITGLPELPGGPAPQKRTMKWSLQGAIPIEEDLVGRGYLRSRGIDVDLAVRCGVRAKGAYLVAPLYTPDSSLPSAHMERGMVEDGTWYFRHHGDPEETGHKGMYVFASPETIGREKREWGVLVEGVGDLLKHPLLVRQGVVVLGATLHPCIAKWLATKFHKIVVWRDNDRAGLKMYKKIKKEMRGQGVRVRVFLDETCKDPGKAVPRNSLQELDVV